MKYECLIIDDEKPLADSMLCFLQTCYYTIGFYEN